MNNCKKKVLIDLDGVLNYYDGKFNENLIPQVRSGADEFLKTLNKSADLYLFTTRNLIMSVKWLIKNKLDIYFKDVTNVKIPAYLYIDDRTICFDGNYNKMLKDIKEFKAYWKH